MFILSIKRAFYDTLKSQLTAVAMLLCGAILGLLYLRVFEGEKVARDEIPYIEAGIFGAVSALILLFIWNLICAPYRIERDAHNETKEKLLKASSGHQKLSLQDFISSRDAFTVKEAACILVGQPITSGELLGVAAGKSTDIKRKLINGDIASVSDISLQINLAHLKSDVPYQSLTPNSPEAEFLNEVEISKETLIELGFKPEDHQPQLPHNTAIKKQR